jgi:hypothetical protein
MHISNFLHKKHIIHIIHIIHIYLILKICKHLLHCFVKSQTDSYIRRFDCTFRYGEVQRFKNARCIHKIWRIWRKCMIFIIHTICTMHYMHIWHVLHIYRVAGYYWLQAGRWAQGEPASNVCSTHYHNYGEACACSSLGHWHNPLFHVFRICPVPRCHLWLKAQSRQWEQVSTLGQWALTWSQKPWNGNMNHYKWWEKWDQIEFCMNLSWNMHIICK